MVESLLASLHAKCESILKSVVILEFLLLATLHVCECLSVFETLDSLPAQLRGFPGEVLRLAFLFSVHFLAVLPLILFGHFYIDRE